jgi:hypothetical protein
MMSQARLDAIVAEQIAKGRDAGQIARATGVPPARVQATMHRLRGTDGADANRKTRAKRRQAARQRDGIRPSLHMGQ